MNDPFMAIAMVLGFHVLLWFVVGLYLKRNDVADFAWGLAFISAAVSTYLTAPHSGLRSGIVLTLVCIWGVRLSFHIAQRLRSHPEDRRYEAWRKAWGKHVHIRAFFQIYLLQTVLAGIVVSPALIAIRAPIESFTLYDFVGITLWIVGFVFEVVGDRQLRVFMVNRKSPQEVLTTGLWKYTRHPNYFGESLMWFGLFVVGLSLGWNGLYGIIGALTIYTLVRYISGVPLLEKTMMENEAYRIYAQKTSVFFPWLSR
jgi:steroid 5-alpha reductase family enzyme